MGKHGPCYHCGVTSTPLWRNGPPEKPVLCNACGSRWRTKGTLVNYTPLHKRDVLELEVPKRPKEKSSFLTLKVKNLPKGQWSNRIVEAESGIGEYGQSFLKGIDEDTSNRSSSGSAMSFSESCANFLGADASEETGSFQSNAWETIVPSRKRTGVIRPKRSAVEKLTMDLHSIMHEQSSYMTVSSEEDLLYESNTSTGLIEIGNGSVLIRHPNSALIEEESEASSLPMQNKSFSTGLSLMMDCQSEIPSASNARDVKIKNTPAQEQSKRDRASSEKLHILQNKDSKLGFIDLGDIVCFEGYMKHLTDQERQQLMRYLPSVDTTNFPESLETMFTSPQFVESLSCFQDLLRQGIFNLSTSMLKFDDCKNLRKLILSNVTKCVWAESFKIFKDAKHDTKQSRKGGHCGTTFLGSSSTISLKRPHESHNDNFAEPKVATKNLKKFCKTASSSIPSTRFVKDATGELEKKPQIGSYDHKKSDGLIGSPETLCAPPKRSFIFDSLQPTDCSLEEDLLLDVRSSTSFPEAELLSNAWLPNLPGQRFCGESGVSTKEGSLLCQSAVSFTGDMP